MPRHSSIIGFFFFLAWARRMKRPLEKKSVVVSTHGEEPTLWQKLGWNENEMLRKAGQTVSTLATAISEKIEIAQEKIDSTVEALKQEHERFVLECEDEEEAEEEDGALYSGRRDELPWLETDATLKARVLALSRDDATFREDPPERYEFSVKHRRDLILRILELDPNLKRAHSKLAHRFSEHTFWRNYFYKCAILRRAAGLDRPPQEAQQQREDAREDAREEDARDDAREEREDELVSRLVVQEEEDEQPQQQQHSVVVAVVATPPPSRQEELPQVTPLASCVLPEKPRRLRSVDSDDSCVCVEPSMLTDFASPAVDPARAEELDDDFVLVPRHVTL
mmetsp:Transcript_7370/g.22701  ORF Transcript_7370/g.22701 Transcript_7370/m.22701 type:complete len:338 (+) Transcript_7370:2-1015(+)